VKKVIILTSDPQLPTIKLLQKACDQLEIEALAINPEQVRIVKETSRKRHRTQLAVYLENTAKPPKNLPPDSFVIPRFGSISSDYFLSVVLAFEKCGFVLANSYGSLLRVRNKVNALIELVSAGLPTLPFILIRNPKLAKEQIGLVGRPPYTVKFIRGSQGLGVIKVTDTTSASALVSAFNRLGYDVYVEKFLGGSKKDLRFILVNGRVVAAMVKKPMRGEYRGNIHLGAKAEPHKPTRQETALAEKVAKLFGLGFCAVDMLKSAKDYFILEVNASPGLFGISQALGRNLAVEVLKKLMQSIDTK